MIVSRTNAAALCRIVGLYYSLQYLSLADATVITFLGPLATGLLGFLVLGEPFTVRETLGGVISLSGVVLIARPAFIFGRKTADSDLDNPLVTLANGTLAGNNSTLKVGEAIAKLVNVTSVDLVRRGNSTLLQDDVSVEGVTEKQRLFAVGLALLGVCGGAGAYITIRAIGRRASATHSVAYFSLYSTIVSAALMWFTDTKFVLPTQPKWIALLVCVGIFGLAAQVSHLPTTPHGRILADLLLRFSDSVGDGIAARESRKSSVSDIPPDRVCVAVPACLPPRADSATQRNRYGRHPRLSRLGSCGKGLRDPFRLLAHSARNLHS